MPKRKPEYDLQEFISACGNRKKVTVLRSALETANDFNLRTQAAILSWIANGGIEKPVHANTETWRNNPNPKTLICVDSYDFYSGEDYGYLALMYQPLTGKWLVKSLKMNDKPDPRPRTMAAALRKAGW